MRNKIAIVIAILSLQFIGGTYMNAVTPILATMGQALNVTDPSTLSLVATMPALAMIITNLLCGRLTQTMKTKPLIYFGLVLFLIGGIGPVFASDINTILVLRAIMGLGGGFIMPLGVSLVPSYFSGQPQVTMMGLVNATNGVVCTVAALLGGFLAVISWQTPFWIYTVAIVPLLVVLFFLPEPEKPQLQSGEKPAAIPGIVYLYAGSALILFACIIMVLNGISGFIAGEGMGTVATAGIAVSLFTVGSFVASLLFGKLFAALKRWTLTVAILISVIGILLLVLAPSFSVVCVATVLIGLSIGMLSPTLFTKTALVSPHNVNGATSFVMTGLLAGQFLSSLLMKIIFAVIHTTSMRSLFAADGIIMAVCLVVAAIAAIRTKKVEISSPNAESNF